jgi:alpha-D-xyloside xylohydrolase
MKFTDGFWMLRPGVSQISPSVAHQVETGPDSVTVMAPARVPEGRVGTLGVGTVTVKLSSPAPDVIRVRATHHAGTVRRGPDFALLSDRAPAEAIEVKADESAVSLRSGRLVARIARGPEWRLDFLADGSLLTASEAGMMAAVEWPGHGRNGPTAPAHFMVERLALDVGERVYGLGERFGPFIRNGQSIEIVNRDAGTTTEQAYKNVPFYLTDRGYGVFVNEPGTVSFEVGSELVDRVQFSVEGQSIEYLVVYGPSPKEVLEKYTALTGRPALPPAWSFGLWLSTSFTTDYDQQTAESLVAGMAERNIPLSVFHFDCFWMREYQWIDLAWDERRFPEPAAMLARLHERGVHVCVWINPYVAQASPLFGEGAAAGYLLRRPNGDVWQTDEWQPGMGIVDFTNPAAAAWFRDKLARLLDMGVDCFKTDFGERIPSDVAWFDGSDPDRMHNHYSYLYEKTVFDLLRERRGEGEAVIFARSATAGCQRFPVHWSGDPPSTFPSMAGTLRGGLSLGLSGFGFWSHDIGGFEGSPSPTLYHRWAAFGLLSSHSRLHGSGSYRVPWAIDDKAVDVVAYFSRLKCRLMPYLYGAAVEASRRGIPMLRAMLLEFPDDPIAAYLDRQYMLGGSLLVAPVLNPDGRGSHYVPPGRWTHLITGATLDGPGWADDRYDFLSLPLFVRPGSVVPMGARDDRPDYDFADGVTLAAYELGDGSSVNVEVPGPDGQPAAAFDLARVGATVTVERRAGDKPWRLLLVNAAGLDGVEGGTAEKTAEGVLVSASAGSNRLVARLS